MESRLKVKEQLLQYLRKDEAPKNLQIMRAEALITRLLFDPLLVYNLSKYPLEDAITTTDEMQKKAPEQYAWSRG